MIATTITNTSVSFLVFIFTMLFAIESLRANSTEDLRQKVLDVWQRRQNSVESANFTVRSTLVLTENELQRREHRLKTLHGTKPSPKEASQGDKVLTELHEIAFDGDRVRYFMTFDKSTHEIAKSVNRNMTLLYVTNGVDYRCLETFPDHGVKSGIIQNADQFMVFRNEDIKPIILAFRAFSKHLPQFTNNLKIVDGKHEIAGQPVIVMQHIYDGASSGGVQYWIDPSRDYVVSRMLAMAANGRVGSQTDAEYKQDHSGNWVPVKWLRSDFDADGDLRRSYEFKVVEFEINPELSESLFELEFEPGIEVFDKRNGVNRASIWTVNKDGTKTMKQGRDPDKSADVTTSRRVLLWANGIILLLLVIFFLFRRKHEDS